jgi:hypothetical protein
LGVSGASPPYTYSWNTGQSTNDITQIAGGQFIVTITDSEGCQEVDTFQVDSQVYLSELFDGKMKLYPNPNDGSFYLFTEEGAISNIFDAYGRQIAFEIAKIEPSKYEFHLKQALPGVYYLQIVHENEQTKTIRFEVF